MPPAPFVAIPAEAATDPGADVSSSVSTIAFGELYPSVFFPLKSSAPETGFFSK